MNILHISRPDRNGAGIIPYTIHEYLLNKSYKSKLLVLNDESPGFNVVSMKHAMSGFDFCLNYKRIKLKIIRSTIKHDLDYCPQGLYEEYIKNSSENILNKVGVDHDVIILYFLDDFVNAKIISELHHKTGAKIYWFLMDMAAMTGGCNYAWDCSGFKRECGCCPAIFSKNAEDITHKNMLIKKKYLTDIDLTIIAGTQWLYEKCKMSSLFSQTKIERIMIPIDETIFCPQDRLAARKYFNLPEEKKIIFLGMQKLKEKRKGMYYLLEALKILKNRRLKKDDIHLVIAGNHFDTTEMDLSFDYTYVGLLALETELPKAFNAADIFICPSVEDAGPMMINQSILSGTPVVSFNMGVAADLVLNGETGYCATLMDSDDLAAGIEILLNLSNGDLNKMRQNCRELGLKKTATVAVFDKIETLILNGHLN